MREKYFSRTIWKLSFTYVRRGNYLPQATQPMHPNYSIGVNRIIGVSTSNVRIANELLIMLNHLNGSC